MKIIKFIFLTFIFFIPYLYTYNYSSYNLVISYVPLIKVWYNLFFSIAYIIPTIISIYKVNAYNKVYLQDVAINIFIYFLNYLFLFKFNNYFLFLPTSIALLISTLYLTLETYDVIKKKCLYLVPYSVWTFVNIIISFTLYFKFI